MKWAVINSNEEVESDTIRASKQDAICAWLDPCSGATKSWYYWATKGFKVAKVRVEVLDIEEETNMLFM